MWLRFVIVSNGRRTIIKYWPRIRKRVFRHMQTAKAKISLRCLIGTFAATNRTLEKQIKCINGGQMPWWDFAYVQDDVNPHILRMLGNTFSLGVAHTLRKYAYSNTLEVLPPKNGNFSYKIFWYFSYFYSKHRLWVFVRTASTRRF